MVKMKLDKKSVKAIQNKLKAMPKKMQKKAVRSSIDPEAKKLSNQFKSVSPISKRKHKNKYRKRIGSGFLKKSFSIRNSGRGEIVGRRIVTRAIGYYIHMTSSGTGRRAGSKGKTKWGAVSGSRIYSKIWQGRQHKITSNIFKTLQIELGKI